MMLKVSGISKSFGKIKVLDNINFTLDKPSITGLVGRNGSGKTTLLKILAGIYIVDDGSFELFGKKIKDDPKIIKKLAFLPDRFDYFNYYKVKDIPDFYKIIYENFDSDYFFTELNKNKIDPNQNIRTLSKGFKNLIGLITVIASRAEILLLDEILDGMDVINKNNIINYILDARDEGRSILASSHDISSLSGLCENLLYLKRDGKLKVANLNESMIKKYQIVVKDKLPSEFLPNFTIISSIGRVYVVLVDDSDGKVESYLKNEEIIQYDRLGLRIEDYFYMEDGGKNV